jgi:hypothetical protein
MDFEYGSDQGEFSKASEKISAERLRFEAWVGSQWRTIAGPIVPSFSAVLPRFQPDVQPEHVSPR